MREEILPGEVELLNIIRGVSSSKKDPDRVCIHCGGMFASSENRIKHLDRCLRGISAHRIGKISKDNWCIKCSKGYCNKNTLINHSRSCTGDMCNTAPVGISEPEDIEVEICKGTAAQLSIS